MRKNILSKGVVAFAIGLIMWIVGQVAVANVALSGYYDPSQQAGYDAGIFFWYCGKKFW